MVALPGPLFYNTQIPACLWFLARNQKNNRFRDRRGETLFIDARKLGVLTNKPTLPMAMPLYVDKPMRGHGLMQAIACSQC